MQHGAVAVDSHVHPISDDLVRFPLRNGQRSDRSWSQTPMPVEEMLTRMDAASVDCAVLVQSAAVYGFDNSYVTACIAAYPQRCAGMCAVDVNAADAADVLERLVRQEGVQGWRITNRDFDSPASLLVWQRAEALGIPVCVQLQPTGLDKLPALLDRFAGVRVALDHAANVNRVDRDPEEVRLRTAQLLELSVHPNLFLKLTTPNFEGIRASGRPPESFLGPLCDLYGARRLMWGTDYPATADLAYSGRLQQAEEALDFLTEEDKSWVFGKTALLLWPSLQVPNAPAAG